MWTLQGLLGGVPWQDMVRNEVGGLLPWAFLAPWVDTYNARVARKQPGRWRYAGAHALGMVLIYIPYWFLLRVIGFVWRGVASGWSGDQFVALVPTTANVVGAFLNVPFIYFLILLGAEAMTHARARQEEAAQGERLARQLSDARLALLQRQLHPHFLFNALQAISTLIHRDPATADRLLIALSNLLREMLDGASGQTMRLGTELELVRKYLEIEQVRFGDRLTVEWRVDNALLNIDVPSLIVLPLVENAIRHGLSTKIGAGRVTVGAHQDGRTLVLSVEDDGTGAGAPLAPGLGLGNTRERLAALYGDRASLAVDTAPQHGFRAIITLPMETPS